MLAISLDLWYTIHRAIVQRHDTIVPNKTKTINRKEVTNMARQYP